MQTSANDMGGLAIDEYLNDEADQAANRAAAAKELARIESCKLVIADMPQGDLFIVCAGDKYEGPSQVLVTSSRDKAFARFNAEIETTYEGDIVVVRAYRSIDDEFQPDEHVRKEGAYRFTADSDEGEPQVA